MTSGAPGALFATIMVIADDADAVHVERQTSLLRDELSRLDVEDVRRPKPGTAAPDGARGAELAVAGALLVEILPLLPNLRSLVDVVGAWSRRSRTTVTVTIGDESIVVDGATDAHTDRLVAMFVDRHTRPDV
jgi:hypothetical protein